MPWQIVILLSLDQAPTFYRLHFQCHETSLSVPLTWSFLPASYPTGYPFRYKHFPHLCQASSPSLSSCGSTSQVSLESEGVNIPRVCGLLVASRESSGVITVCTFICKPVPSFGYFPQCHVGWFITGRQRLRVLLAISDLKNRRTVTVTSRLGKKWRDDVHLLFM